MKIWLSKNAEISVREQLIQQITLGIGSGDLLPGERLPSTRELARRFSVHPNTVSAAYRELASQALVKYKKGSGIYICEPKERPENVSIEALITKFFSEAAGLGYSREEILIRLSESLRGRGFSGFAVVEPNPALREIIVEEIRAATGCIVQGIEPGEISASLFERYQIAAMYDLAEKLTAILPDNVTCVYLRTNSVAGSLAGREPPSEGELIGIASGWDDFLTLAKVFLLAAKIDSDAIVTCSTQERNWRRPLKNVSAIICDSLTAQSFEGDMRVKVFPVIAESSLDELRRLVRHTVVTPR